MYLFLCHIEGAAPIFDDSLYVTLSEVDFSTHEKKKKSSPLVYKVAKIPLSYDPRFPKIYSVNGKKEFAAARSFTYEYMFSRKLL